LGRNTIFLQHCWYAAGWTDEINRTPQERMVCGEKLVLFRRADATVAALSGICPHRFASLSVGKLIAGDAIECPYHGLRFDSHGNCVHNPHGVVPPAVRLKAYTVVERYSLVWLWWGDTASAVDELIPDFSCLIDSRYRTIHGTIQTGAHYELVTDNLMDLSHVGFVHAGGIGSESIQNGKHQVFQTGTTIDSNRWCPDALAPPVWDALFGNYGKSVDHWLDMRWDPPASMLLDVGIAPAGGARQGGIAMLGAHILTPQTESSTAYLWASARDFARTDENIDAGLRASITQAFITEDKPMIEQVQRNMGDRSFDQLNPLLLPFDKGGVLARRMLADLVSGKRKLLPTQRRTSSTAEITA
jgi:phenylpropionate dioxygenase-like ring-hydroxylating dioxygenase large terminal subunit